MLNNNNKGVKMNKEDKALLTFTKCFLPKNVLKMSEDKQLEYVKKWSQDSFDNLPDMKITKSGEVKEKNRLGQWEVI